MKRFLLFIPCSAFALAAFGSPATSLTSAAPYLYRGSVTLDWTVHQQATYAVLGSTTTNHTGTGANSVTNITQTLKWTATNFTLGNAGFLKLLENSFATNFPQGARLKSGGQSLLVVDKTGSNIVQDISSVVSIQIVNAVMVAPSKLTFKEVIMPTWTAELVSPNYKETCYESLQYNDTALITADGTHSNFHFDGLASFTDDVTDKMTGPSGGECVTLLNGIGTGTIHGKGSILSGSIISSAKVVGEYPVP